MAFSKWRVTVTIILSTGCRPASAIIFILGKVISGNNAVCIFVYANAPPKQNDDDENGDGVFICSEEVVHNETSLRV